MKGRKALLCLIFLSVLSVGAFATTEGFDNVAALPGSGWVIMNFSTPVGTTDWFQGNPSIFTAHSGAPDSYIAANFNAAGPGGFAWDWLNTPLTTLNNGDVFSFWTRGANEGFADDLVVSLDLSGGVAGGLVLLEINPFLDPYGYPGDWTQYMITISGLSGPTLGRLNLIYYVPDTNLYGDYIGIDDFSYTPVPEPFTMSMVGIGLAGAALRRKLHKA